MTDGPVRGVRFLPAHDPWLLDRDRAALVPDVVGRRVLWRAAGSPGVVLVDDEPVAAWRTKTDRAQLALVVDHLPGAPPVDADELADEAQLVGAALGATDRVAVRPSGSKGAR